MMDSYEKGLLEKCNELNNAFANFILTPEDKMQRETLARQCHSLKGGGDTFGYQLISIIAAAADEIFTHTEDLKQDELHTLRNHLEAMSVVARYKLTGNGGKAGKLLLDGLNDCAKRNH